MTRRDEQDAFIAASRRMARVASRPSRDRTLADRGAALIELLDFADAVMRHLPRRPMTQLQFPVLSRLTRAGRGTQERLASTVLHPKHGVGSLSMPTVSSFYGIGIWMYRPDHAPPHFHAQYGEEWAQINITSRRVIAGSLAPRALRLVREWARLHEAELCANWDRAQDLERLEPIEGLP